VIRPKVPPRPSEPRGGFIGPGRGVDMGGGVLLRSGGVTGVRFPAFLQFPLTSGAKVLSSSYGRNSYSGSYLPPRLSEPEARFQAGRTGVKSFRLPLPSPLVSFSIGFLPTYSQV